MMPDLSPLILTLELALITTLVLFLVGVPLAYWLKNGNRKVTYLVEALVSLPLILPPSVLGFYLLLAFSPGNAFGAWLDNWFNIRLAFSFEGLVLASVIYSLPFLVHPVLSGFRDLSPNLKEAALTMGASKWRTFWKVEFPNLKYALITGGVLGFAHTIGEFGVVLMIGGNIPGETRVASIAIFNEVEALNYGTANVYSLFLLGFSFLFLVAIHLLNRKRTTVWSR